MPRVKGGVNALKRRRNVLKQVKGYRFGRSTKERQAREAIVHAGKYAFTHRREKKNDFRRLWNIKINAGVLDFLALFGFRYIRSLLEREEPPPLSTLIPERKD